MHKQCMYIRTYTQSVYTSGLYTYTYSVYTYSVYTASHEDRFNTGSLHAPVVLSSRHSKEGRFTGGDGRVAATQTESAVESAQRVAF